MNLYPLMLDLTDRLAVVVGSGAVGLRKARALLEAGARVKVVDLAARRASEDNRHAHAGASGYQPNDLDGACLVFAAATPEVNAQVVADAKARGIWVNSADDPETCDFYVPAVVRRGELRIAISTGGTAPAIAKSLRERLESQFDDAWAEWLEIQTELRKTILETIADVQTRRDLFVQFADPAWLERFRSEGRAAVTKAMRQVVVDAVLR